MKTRLAGDAAHGLVEPQPFLFIRSRTSFERGENTVPFVQMEHARRNAHALQGPNAADAQHQFLANARPVVAAIEPGGQFAILGPVRFDVGIEQQQSVPADGQLPHPWR